MRRKWEGIELHLLSNLWAQRWAHIFVEVETILEFPLLPLNFQFVILVIFIPKTQSLSSFIVTLFGVQALKRFLLFQKWISLQIHSLGIRYLEYSPVITWVDSICSLHSYVHQLGITCYCFSMLTTFYSNIRHKILHFLVSNGRGLTCFVSQVLWF